jgi:hypothetical protein
MVIQSRSIVAAAAALLVVGAALWCSAVLFEAPADHTRRGSVEVVQLPGPSWAVEIKDLGASEPAEAARTAANR